MPLSRLVMCGGLVHSLRDSVFSLRFFLRMPILQNNAVLL